MKKFILLLLLLILPCQSYAWEPTQTVNTVIGFAPGSGNEISFRGLTTIVQKNNPKFNYQIDYKPGVDGILGMNYFIQLPSNGYNIYVASHQGIWVTAEYFNKEAVKYNLNDFEYGLTLAKSPLAIIAKSDSIVTTPKELIEYLKNVKSPVNFAAGSGAHKLAFDYMMEKLDLNKDLFKTVGYKGPAQAASDVAGGHLEFGIVPVAVANSLIQSKSVKLIALCSDTVLPAIPNAELMDNYIKGMNVYAAWAIIFPKNTDKAIIDWYVTEYSKAINSEQGKKFFNENYMFSEPKEQSPLGLKQSMTQLRNQWIPILEKFKY